MAASKPSETLSASDLAVGKTYLVSIPSAGLRVEREVTVETVDGIRVTGHQPGHPQGTWQGYTPHVRFLREARCPTCDSDDPVKRGRFEGTIGRQVVGMKPKGRIFTCPDSFHDGEPAR